MTLVRDARGKRPQFFEDRALDHALSMILVLAEEQNVLRDRLDTVERVATANGLADAIEAYEPPLEVLEQREARRQAFFARLYYLARKDAADAAGNMTDDSYNATIAELARE